MLHKTAHRNHRNTPLENARRSRKELSCTSTAQIERGLFTHMQSLRRPFIRQIPQCPPTIVGRYALWSRLPEQASRSFPCRQEIVWFHEKISLRHHNKETDKEWENTKLAGIYCQDISVITLPSIRKEAELDRRRRPSTFENMPFLMQEDASLGARKASSSVQFVTYWPTVCYKLSFRRYSSPILRMYGSIRCKDFLWYYR